MRDSLESTAPYYYYYYLRRYRTSVVHSSLLPNLSLPLHNERLGPSSRVATAFLISKQLPDPSVYTRLLLLAASPTGAMSPHFN